MCMSSLNKFSLEDNINSITATMPLKMDIRTELKSALTNSEFLLHYQPIVALKTGKITGFEALVRWLHPTHGLISPLEFIPLAEETGLIMPLGEWILQTACWQLYAWQQKFPANPPLTMSVNLSSKQLACETLLPQVERILQETALAASSLRLEITESGMMENPDSASALIFQLRTLGIQIYIDDFGTGYSSLSRLHELPLDALKIDRSFVTGMGKELVKLQIIQTITTLAWNIGLEVIAEGVETAEQSWQLKSLGCNYGQGYFFSKPVDAIAATQLIEQELCKLQRSAP